MKLTAFILFVTIMQVSATTYAQKLTLKEKNVSIVRVFDEIKKQTGYDVFYLPKELKTDKKINADFNNASLDEVMEACLDKQPVTYKIDEKTIVISKKEPSILDKVKNFFQAVDVTGKVVDENGQPLAGATVKVKDGNLATTTDARGEFSLKQVQPDAMLVITFVGYQQLEVKAAANMGNIVMKVADSQLDQVQVIAYGKTSQRLNTGNVTTIKAQDIEKQPVNNPLLALQGRVPGLFIQQSTGLPGTAVKVRIQGENSLLNGNDPLYVIDGVPYSSQSLANLGSILAAPGAGQSGYGNGNNPLSFINPQDIESISVLKDADATSIYGSRAANGAILITTKKGNVGDTRVSFNLQQGQGKVTRKMDLLNAQQYLEMRHEGLKNDNAGVSGTDYDLNGNWDTTRTTDWQKELIGNTANYTDMQMSVSGGNNNTQYLIGSGYHHETTVFPGDFADQKVSMHFNINNTSLNKRFKVQLSGSYLYDNNELPNQDLTAAAIRLSPVAPAVYNADGTLNWQLNSSGSSTWTNPLSYTMAKYNNKTNNLFANSIISYNIFKNLTASVSTGYTDLTSKDSRLTSINYYAPQNRKTNSPYAYYGNYEIHTWIVEPQLTYIKLIGQSKFDFLVGSTFQKSNSRSEQFTGLGFQSDLLLGDISTASSIIFTPTVNKVYAYSALFARLNYNLSDKYILNVTARRDGSSRFGPENRFHNFGSIGGAWVFSEENILKRKFQFFSLGKIRASYGTTGSDQIDDYRYLDLYKAVSSNLPYLGSKGIQPTGLFNPYLQWEETKKLQIGVDLAFFKDRILLNTTYFRNRSSNQLLNYQLPNTTGFQLIAQNLPATLENSGWEFVLNTKNIENNLFSWTSTFNLTVPKNKLYKFDDIANSFYATAWTVGEPFTVVDLFKFEGVDPTNGQYLFQDHMGKITTAVSGLDDKIVRVNTSPKYYGGIQNNFQIKGFQLSFFLQFVKQRGQNAFFGTYLPGRFDQIGNQPTTVLNRWQELGDQTQIQKYNSNRAIYSQYLNAVSSDVGFGDASYIRLKNLSLSYQLPSDISKKLHLENLRIYTAEQNLLTWTKYIGLDPETKSSLTLPPLKVWTLGVQATF